MGRKDPFRTILAAIAVFGLFIVMNSPGVAQTSPQYSVASRPTTTASRGVAAIDSAAHSGKHLFIYFWKANDKQNQTMYGVFKSAMDKWASSADAVAVQISDPNERPIVDKYGVSRAPMPLVLAIAPNGAVTKGFPIKFDEKQLREGFASPGTAKCLKALQERKLVLVCVQNERTQLAQEAMSASMAFKADPRYTKATEIVVLNPEDRAEHSLLTDLKVDPRSPQAVTVVLAPPGQPVASFVGAVTKEQIVAKIEAGPCADGKCGPNGCCPPKK